MQRLFFGGWRRAAAPVAVLHNRFQLITIRPKSKELVAFRPEHLGRSTIGGDSCTRICARMTTFLLVGRKRGADNEKSRFPLVNRCVFETKRDVLKSMISKS
jgi:hypothetical protein